MNKAVLKTVTWPDFGQPEPIEPFAEAEIKEKIDQLYRIMEQDNYTHIVVYGDKEHFANLAYLTGMDPRFEEALLILTPRHKPLLLIGNECEAYLEVCPLYRSGAMEALRYPPFSLIDQPRDDVPDLSELLSARGVDAQSRIGCIGWKYYRDNDRLPQPRRCIEIPAYIVDILRRLSSDDAVFNAGELLMDAERGLKSECTAREIAFFEYTGTLAARQYKRMLFNLRVGMSDFEAASELGYTGLPFSCHLTFSSGERTKLAFPSPGGHAVERGQPIAANIAYWGSNICRAGWVAESADDLPASATDYVKSFVAPYFSAIVAWLGALRIGACGGELYNIIADRLPFDQFGIYLNPGHLIHLDEWINAPVYRDSAVKLKPGMVFQLDIIPSSERYFSTRAEDGFALADAKLQTELKQRFPAMMNRCRQRRLFMTEQLGIKLAAEVLPLCDMAGIIPPYFLSPQQIMVMNRG